MSPTLLLRKDIAADLARTSREMIKIVILMHGDGLTQCYREHGQELANAAMMMSDWAREITAEIAKETKT